MDFHQYCQSDHRCFWMEKTQLREGSVQPNVVSDSYKYTGMDRSILQNFQAIFA